MSVLLLSCFFFFLLLGNAEQYEDVITNHLGTKSPYRYVANMNCTKDNKLQGCVKKIWMLTRHGTRNPNVLQIQKMQGYLPILKDIILERNSNISSSNLVESDIELFQNWYPSVNEKDSKKLTIEGEHEMLELAERMQARFPDLLPPVYSNTSYKVMEYNEDLKYYWVDGYGKEITYKQACSTFNNMLDFMTGEDAYPQAVLYFTHSGTLLKMLSHLNLYKDDKSLWAADYDNNHNRKWRVSKIDTFGSNLAFILYKCNGENKLLVLHNEVPVKLPSCPDSELCDLEKIKDYYSSSKLLKSDIELFENWRPTVNENDAKKLTSVGARDMVKLAKRMQAKFPDVLPPVYSNTSYTFKFTKAQQTRRSAQFFAVGLFQNSQIVKDIHFPEAIKRDPILSVIEYAEDLKYYWKDGYGYEITYKQACKTFNDMFAFING
ncbi:multiple inositol polyphosphate phosphatase-related [Holotrichia oblita]|uniref:Multiple inositol polyphosphate phosphatase-related n=1 Tax=Holotrichia oblita TaxID=644536 RepID=A0ACB9SPW8_HOLOL|nr:multiple inositol polyphosphate phosphatase-related [Holotrichia oblita]